MSGIVVVLLVAAGEANAPITTTVVAAAAEALGPAASFIVRESASPSDNEALTLEDELHASSVAEIVWSGNARTHVMLRVHVAKMDRWVQRELTFLPADQPKERSRTLGFAIASMLIAEGETRPRTPPAAVPESTGTRAESPKDTSVAQSGATEPERKPRIEPGPNRVDDAPPASAPDAPQSLPEPEVPPQPPPEPFSADLVAVGSSGIGGPAAGLGGAAHFQYFVQGTLWLAAGAGVRTGALSGQTANDLVVSAMAGGLWRPFFPTAVRPFELGIGVQMGMLFHEVTYRSGAALLRGHRLIPGGQLMAEGGFRLNAAWEMIVGLGLEMAFGTSEVVDVDQQPPRSIATIPRFRALGAAGLRFHF